MRRTAFSLALLAVCVHAEVQAQNLPGFLRRLVPGGEAPASGAPAPTAVSPSPSAGAGETSIDEEVALGRQLAGRLLGAAPLVRDDRIQQYVNRVGRWIALQSDRPALRWQFGVIESGDVNAFAMPGGYVFITRGLFDRLSSESELAGVLGHEIAHVVAGHHMKLYQQSRALGAASGILGQLVGRRDSTGLAQNLIGNGAEALARGLDKDAEHEADRNGTVLAVRAGYEPYGLASVLAKLARINPGDAGIALLFKTHPAPQERLAVLGDAMGATLEPHADGRTNDERFSSVAPRR